MRRLLLTWLVAMVAYTMLSLWLIAQPLTKEDKSTPDSGLSRPAVTAPRLVAGPAAP